MVVARRVVVMDSPKKGSQLGQPEWMERHCVTVVRRRGSAFMTPGGPLVWVGEGDNTLRVAYRMQVSSKY